MFLIKHSEMLQVDDLAIAALSYLVSGWIFKIYPCSLAKLQVLLFWGSSKYKHDL